MSSSYKLWSPETITSSTFILVDDEPDIVSLFRSVTEIGSVGNTFAREYGTRVWLLRDPKTDIGALYRKKRQAEMASIMSY